MTKGQEPRYRHLRDELKPGFVRGQWIAQRIGWALMALFIIAAIVGFLGSGLISRDRVSSSLGDVSVSAEYERWTRRKTPQELRLSIEAPSAHIYCAPLVPAACTNSIAAQCGFVTPLRAAACHDQVRGGRSREEACVRA